MVRWCPRCARWSHSLENMSLAVICANWRDTTARYATTIKFSTPSTRTPQNDAKRAKVCSTLNATTKATTRRHVPSVCASPKRSAVSSNCFDGPPCIIIINGMQTKLMSKWDFITFYKLIILSINLFIYSFLISFYRFLSLKEWRKIKFCVQVSLGFFIKFCLLTKWYKQEVRRINLDIEQKNSRIFNSRLHLAQEGDRLSAINKTMIIGEAHIHHGSNLDLEMRCD